MSNDKLGSTLKSLMSPACSSLPESEGEISRRRQWRIGQSVAGATYILCDVSSSMSEYAGEESKYELLRRALDRVTGRLIAFNSFVMEVSTPDALPKPSGGTALHLAIDFIRPYRPAHTIVISDGEPDDEADALVAANNISGIIDVIFIGDDRDIKAKNFMRKLARRGCGRAADLSRELSKLPSVIRGLLGSGA